jgi:hypothetical protein
LPGVLTCSHRGLPSVAFFIGMRGCNTHISVYLGFFNREVEKVKEGKRDLALCVEENHGVARRKEE